MEHLMMAARARALSQLGVEGLRTLVAEADTPRPEGLAPARRAALLYQASLSSLQLRDSGRASAYAARLAPLALADAGAARLVGLLKLELALDNMPPKGSQGDGAAVDRLMAGMDLNPGSPRRPELLAIAKLMLRVGRPAEASRRLHSWVSEHPRDAAAWEMLAAASDAQGQALRGIRAQAEARVAHYDYAAALDRFKAAQELMRKPGAGGDHLEASIIDARARQVALLAREQALER